MLADPDLTGSLLTVGVSLAARLDFGGPWPDLAEIATEVCRPPEPPSAFVTAPVSANLAHASESLPKWHMVAHWLREDARTYQPPRLVYRCAAPMVRKTGVCGRSAREVTYLTNWSTGERIPLAGCSRHEEWFKATRRAHLESKPGPVPLPKANHGGVLARHFPEIDWPALWHDLDRRWVQHPEPVPWPKPTLTLLRGDAHPTDAPRPALFAVPTTTR